ncbi:MAG: hypothetical protein ACREI9_16225 [Nitrospiraceae bacterium]
MFKAIDSPYLVPFNRNFKYTDALTKPPDGIKPKDELKTRLDKLTEELDSLQRVLYAQDRYALLLIFQAMDAAGKDSTIRAVMKGVDRVLSAGLWRRRQIRLGRDSSAPIEAQNPSQDCAREDSYLACG